VGERDGARKYDGSEVGIGVSEDIPPSGGFLDENCVGSDTDVKVGKNENAGEVFGANVVGDDDGVDPTSS
jgi:hypothetical protein